VLELPAGDLATTFDAGFDWKRIESEDTRSATDAQFTRRRLNGGVNLVVPIAERGGAWGAIGSLSANLGAGFEDLSDFGTLYDWSAGLTWAPVRGLTLSATYIVSEQAPSLTQLGSPQVVTLNVPTYDFAAAETVLATIISGGNPDLSAETQKDWKFSANWDLPFWRSTSFQLDYIRNRSTDVTSSFPALTAAIETAFPGRVTRDPSGQLVSIDRRPVTFASTSEDRLVFGFTTRGEFGKARTEAGSNAGTRRGRGGGGPPMPGRGDDGRGRYFVNLSHTIKLDSTILVADDGPLLDLLDGDATSDTGQERHSSRLEAGMFRNGWGLRLSGSYIGETRIDGSGLPGSSDLLFGDLARFDLRIFADLGRVLKQESGPLKNFRISLRADNAFDARRRVTDSSGDVPLSYQPFLIDPTGRYLGVDLRKLF